MGISSKPCGSSAALRSPTVLTRKWRLLGERGYVSVLVDGEEVRALVRGPDHGGLTGVEIKDRLSTTAKVAAELIKHGYPGDCEHHELGEPLPDHRRSRRGSRAFRRAQPAPDYGNVVTLLTYYKTEFRPLRPTSDKHRRHSVRTPIVSTSLRSFRSSNLHPR